MRPSEACQCGCETYWQSITDSEWRCKNCKPPKLRALIKIETTIGDLDPMDLPPGWIIRCGEPCCIECECMVFVEEYQPDGGCNLVCWTCGAQAYDPWIHRAFIQASIEAKRQQRPRRLKRTSTGSGRRLRFAHPTPPVVRFFASIGWQADQREWSHFEVNFALVLPL